MKRLLIILCILLFVTPCLANQIIIGKKKAAAACNPASNELGERTAITAGTANLADGVVTCILYTPDCYGTFGTGYVYAFTADDDCKACVYSDDGNETPGEADLKIGCTAGDSVTGEAWLTLTTKIGGTAASPNKYWLCLVGGTDGCNHGRLSSGGSYSAYLGSGWTYATPPANLGTGGWGAADTEYSRSVYVEIE